MAAEAGRCGPFRFFAGLLGPGGGRSLALARLGAEAGDALDAFLNAALDHERRFGPSLAGFLHRIAATATDVKRDLSASAGEVRVMTVHGAKGLEARIVILADLAPEPGAKRLPKILAVAAAARRARAALAARQRRGRAGDARGQGRGRGADGRGASPAALCRDDAGRGPADRLRRAGQGRGPRGQLVRA